MSIAGLLDHTCRVWALTESAGAQHAVVRTLAVRAGHEAIPCGKRRASTVLANRGPGMAPTGQEIIYMEPEWVVNPRDIIEIYAGPDAPVRVEADRTARPRGHHLEIRSSVWHGKLPTDEGS